MLGSLFNKATSLKVCNFLKYRLQCRCFLWILQNCLRIAFLYNTCRGCCWQFYHSTVKSTGVPVLWFRTSTCFWFWSKHFTRCHTNNSLLCCDKTISRLLELIGHIHLENINCFQFWWNTYTKDCTSNYNVTCQNTFFHFVVGQVPSISGYDFENGRMLCQQKYCIKTWLWESWFWFCSAYLYFADLKTIYFVSCLCCSCKLF